MSQYQKEADDRNAILILKHGKIPSYGLWMGCDIRKESNNQRYNLNGCPYSVYMYAVTIFNIRKRNF